jgi:hypothetical protein
VTSWYSYGQEEAKKEKAASLILIHEDVVHPSKVSQYEACSKELVSLLKTHADTEIKYGVAMTNDFRYLSVTPLHNFAELDKNVWAGLYEKAGKETMQDLFGRFDECYDQHKSYMMVLNHELSYNPNNENMMTDGQNYRRWQEYHVYADKVDEGIKIAQEWKELYESSGVETGYRMYTNGMGMDFGTFIVINWAKDVNDMNAKQMAAQKLLGEKAMELQKRTMAISREYKTYDGWMRLDLSYFPNVKSKLTKKDVLK